MVCVDRRDGLRIHHGHAAGLVARAVAIDEDRRQPLARIASLGVHTASSDEGNTGGCREQRAKRHGRT